MAKGLPDIPLEDRLIVALDTSEADALSLVERLHPSVRIFKVGWPLIISSGGFRIVSQLGERGVKVFLDLKLLDIPETVTNALKVIQARHGNIAFATIHGFNRGLESALNMRAVSADFKILVVTLLTSMDQQDLRDLRIDMSVSDYVMHQAAIAAQAGCDGVIASGREAALIRAEHEKMTIVTPAIRPSWARVTGDDQKRTTTPSEAILNGADYVVVGRPIYQNAPNGDPKEAARLIREELASALANREAAAVSGGSRPKMQAAG